MKTKKFFEESAKFNRMTEVMKNAGRAQHHHALARGYRSLSSGCHLDEYDGKFGRGYILHVPNALRPCGNRFHWIVYFV